MALRDAHATTYGDWTTPRIPKYTRHLINNLKGWRDISQDLQKLASRPIRLNTIIPDSVGVLAMF